MEVNTKSFIINKPRIEKKLGIQGKVRFPPFIRGNGSPLRYKNKNRGTERNRRKGGGKLIKYKVKTQTYLQMF